MWAGAQRSIYLCEKGSWIEQHCAEQSSALMEWAECSILSILKSK